MQFVTKQTAGDDLDSTFMPFDLTGFAVENGSPFFLGCENRTKYQYDDNGNRTTLDDLENGVTILGSHDDQDRLLAYGDYTYTYTGNGSLLSKTDTTTSQTTTYDYDALGNLLGVVLPDGTEIAYLIDGDQRRVMKLVDGSPVEGWLYRDDLRIVAELDGSGAVVSRFVYADGAGAAEAPVRAALTRLGLGSSFGGTARTNVPAYMIQGTDVYRILTDHLGTPRLVVDATTGVVAQEFQVDEWGKVLADSNPGFTPFGFAGGLYDPETGLVRFGARDYDAETGRWTAKDPIRFDGGENLYVYAGNDGVNFVDRHGDTPTAPPAPWLPPAPPIPWDKLLPLANPLLLCLVVPLVLTGDSSEPEPNEDFEECKARCDNRFLNDPSFTRYQHRTCVQTCRELYTN